MRRTAVAAALLLSACTDESIREMPSDCAQRLAVVSLSRAVLTGRTQQAKEALGEEASALARGEVREAEKALNEAQEAARGCRREGHKYE